MTFTKFMVALFSALTVFSAAVADLIPPATTLAATTTLIIQYTTVSHEPSTLPTRTEPVTAIVTATHSPWYKVESCFLRNDECPSKQESDIGCENLLGTPPAPPATNAAICETVPWSLRWSVKIGVPFDAAVCVHTLEAFTKRAPAGTDFSTYQPFWRCLEYQGQTQVIATITNELVGAFNQALQDVYPQVVFGDSGLCVNYACYEQHEVSHIGIKAAKCESAEAGWSSTRLVPTEIVGDWLAMMGRYWA